MYKVTVLFEDSDIEWYLVAAKSIRDAESIVYEMMDYTGIVGIATQPVSPYPIYCIDKDMYDALEYREFSATLKE